MPATSVACTVLQEFGANVASANVPVADPPAGVARLEMDLHDEPLTRRAAGERALDPQAIGPKDWDRYVVHLVEPLLRLRRAPPKAVIRLPASHNAALIDSADGPR